MIFINRKIFIIVACALVSIISFGIIFSLFPASGAGDKAPAEDNSIVGNREDIVAAVYINDDTVPFKEIKRVDFASAFGKNSASHVLKTSEELNNVHVRIEILNDINIGDAILEISPAPSKSVTVNGNGYTITGNNKTDPIIRSYGSQKDLSADDLQPDEYYNGAVLFKELDIEALDSSCVQFYNDISVFVDSCDWSSNDYRVIFGTSDFSFMAYDSSFYSGGSSVLFMNVDQVEGLFKFENCILEGQDDVVSFKKYDSICDIVFSGSKIRSLSGGNAIYIGEMNSVSITLRNDSVITGNVVLNDSYFDAISGTLFGEFDSIENVTFGDDFKSPLVKFYSYELADFELDGDNPSLIYPGSSLKVKIKLSYPEDYIDYDFPDSIRYIVESEGFEVGSISGDQYDSYLCIEIININEDIDLTELSAALHTHYAQYQGE